jgi:peptide/nickel transport system substrate-binding protein
LKKLWKILNAKEKVWFAFFIVLVLFSISFLIGNFYRNQTVAVPAFGGTFIEALSESPHNLNPILATNDADRDLSRLIFSSFLKYNERGELIPDLVASYNISKDYKTYTVKLKDGIFWHDGEPFSADDVVFTINAVQNPEYNSPLRTSWQGVKVEISDNNTIIVNLKTPYSDFIENLALLGILPKHIWSKVLPQNFPLSDLNLKPIGTGPYSFVKLQKDPLGRIISINLTANADYFASSPLIKNLIFKFYLSEEEAVSAFNRKEVDGLLLQSAQNKNQLRGLENSSVFSLPSQRIYAIFLNTDDKILKDKNVRQAINYAVNREELLNKLLGNEGKLAIGPIPPGMPGSSPELSGYNYDPKKSIELLEKNGWIKNEEGIYSKKLGKDKEATPLKLTIVTAKSIQLAATLIRDYLKNIGIESELKIVSLSELQQNYLRDKNYGAILIGESYAGAIDPYIFWHGAAIKDPGLNLSLYNNIKVNKILEDVRQITDPAKKAQKLEEFQKLVINDAPAVFLYSPNYIYIVKNAVKNIKLSKLVIPSDRFSKINEWNIETERIWK